MERLCFPIELNPSKEEQYDSVHQEMSPEMHEAFVEPAGRTTRSFVAPRPSAAAASASPTAAHFSRRWHPVSRRWSDTLVGVARLPLARAAEVWRL